MPCTEVLGYWRRRRKPRQGDNPHWLYRKCVSLRTYRHIFSSWFAITHSKKTPKTQNPKHRHSLFLYGLLQALENKEHHNQTKDITGLCCGFVASVHIQTPPSNALPLCDRCRDIYIHRRTVAAHLPVHTATGGSHSGQTQFLQSIQEKTVNTTPVHFLS